MCQLARQVIDVAIVYVKVDAHNRITAVNSNYFISETDNWIQIDEGRGDKYVHAQGNYLEKSLLDENCVFRYKLHDGAVVERSGEEREADIVKYDPPATIEQRIAELESELRAAKILLGLEE